LTFLLTTILFSTNTTEPCVISTLIFYKYYRTMCHQHSYFLQILQNHVSTAIILSL